MRAIALEYHDVVAGPDFDSSGFRGRGPASYKLTADAFDDHLRAIQLATARVPERVVEWVRAPTTTPLLVTFDDGGAGALLAADLLERRGWHGHFFVTAGRVGSPGFLTAAQTRDLARRGHVIGSHSYSHPLRMGALPGSRILEEWRGSLNVLEDILGEGVDTASVPGGFYREVVGLAAAEAGLKILFTSRPSTRCRSVDGCLLLGRYTLRRWSTAAYAASLAGGGRARFTQQAIYSGLHLLRLLMGERYTRIRQAFWGAPKGPSGSD